MSKLKVNNKASNKKLKEYAILSSYFKVTSNNTLYCEACNTTVSSDTKSHAMQHTKTSVHTDHVKLKEIASGGRCTLTQSSINFEPCRDEFVTELCEVFLALNIPMKKSKHPSFKSFIEKYTHKTVPSESSLRTTHLPKIYKKTRYAMRDELATAPLYAVVDETTDREGRYICNVLLGALLEEGPSAPHLIAVKRLERTNNETVSRCVDESITEFFGDTSARERLLLLLSDAAPYMILAGTLLVAFYPKMIHVTCVVHGLHRVCEAIRAHFTLVNTWISTMKKVFKKAPSRVQLYQELYHELPLPPEPITTRFGTWIEAAVFHAEHFEKLKNVIEIIPAEDDAECVEAARELTMNQNLSLDLICISANYGFLAAKIKQLEDSKLSLCDVFSILDAVHSKLRAARGERSKVILTKFQQVLQKNKGLARMRQASEIHQGTYTGSSPEITKTLSVKEVVCLKYAQLTSCDVERSFSIFKNILTDRRTNFTIENLEMYLVCNYFVNRRDKKESGAVEED